MRLSFVTALALSLLGATLLTSCGKQNTKRTGATPETPARDVHLVQAELRPMERTLQVVGTLAAREEAIVAAQVAGQLEQTLVDLGKSLKAGEGIALIDTTSYEALANASAASLTRAKASAANAAQNLKRIQELQKDKIASTSDLDAAVAAAASGLAEVKAAEANDALARLNLERSRVKAPFDGVIAERIAAVGNYLAIGSPIVRMVQMDPLRLRLDVPERESVFLRAGQAVRVSLEGDTNIYLGALSRVAPAIRADNRSLAVEADVPNPGGLRAGRFARATIVINEREEVVSVPLEALIMFAGLEKVVLVKEGKALEQTVTTGRREQSWVEIVSGLNQGATVVLAPAGIRTGQTLTVVPRAAQPVAVPPNSSR